MTTIESRAVLLSMPRTGSTMITRQLSKHPDVAFVGAIFSERGWSGNGVGRRPIKKELGAEWDELKYRVEHREELLDRVFNKSFSTKCVGIKHHLSGSDQVTKTVLEDAGIAKIILSRSNVLACYSSDRAVRVKEKQASGELPPEAKVEFDPDEFGTYLHRRRSIYSRWQPQFDEAAGKIMKVEYSQIRLPGGIDGLLPFLGLPPAKTEPATAKRNSDDVVSRFNNPEMVRAYLAEHDLEEWAEERPPE